MDGEYDLASLRIPKGMEIPVGKPHRPRRSRVVEAMFTRVEFQHLRAMSEATPVSLRFG